VTVFTENRAQKAGFNVQKAFFAQLGLYSLSRCINKTELTDYFQWVIVASGIQLVFSG